jgi:hypothetical protein
MYLRRHCVRDDSNRQFFVDRDKEGLYFYEGATAAGMTLNRKEVSSSNEKSRTVRFYGRAFM